MDYDVEKSYIENVDPAVERFLKNNGFRKGWAAEHYSGNGNKHKRFLYWYWQYRVDNAGGYVFVSDAGVGIIELQQYSYRFGETYEYEDKWDLHEKVAPLIQKLEDRGKKNRNKNARRRLAYQIRQIKSRADDLLAAHEDGRFDPLDEKVEKIVHHLEEIEEIGNSL